jgi:hypothetical protein
MIKLALPVVMALSWVPAQPSHTPAADPALSKTDKSRAAETITCPITGQKIPSCCCPVKKK